jgi:class 3 adenylate cyclase
VVFRDGDVYGRTVNIASRIADQAQAGEVLTSQETVERVGDVDASFELASSIETQRSRKSCDALPSASLSLIAGLDATRSQRGSMATHRP